MLLTEGESVQVGALHKAGGNGYGQLPLDP